MTKEELLELLPVWFQRIREYPEIMKSYAQAFTELQTNLTSVSNNLYLQRCDEPTLADWERLMKIYPAPGEDLVTRRKRVLSRWSMTGSYSEAYIREQLTQILGANNFEFEFVVVQILLMRWTRGKITMKHYVPHALDMAFLLWYHTAPAHIPLSFTGDYEEDINTTAYVGGICTETIIVNIN